MNVSMNLITESAVKIRITESAPSGQVASATAQIPVVLFLFASEAYNRAPKTNNLFIRA